MTTTTATTATGIAIQKLIEMLCDSTVFRAEVGATVAAGVLPFIFCPEKRYETEDEQQEQAPHVFVVVTLPPGSIDVSLIAGGGKNYFAPPSGTIELQLIRQIDDFSNLHEELVKFLNFSEGVWEYLIEQAAVDDQLAITRAPREMLIQSDEKHVAGYKVQKPFHKAVYTIGWGSA